VSGLDAIDVKVERPIGLTTGNTLPLLHEIRHALERLASTGEPTTIDLSSIPLSPEDRAQLLDTLGKGEVEARLDAFGPSNIRETAYPGVWLVQHMNPQGEEHSSLIEITRFPSLLQTPEADVTDSAAALQDWLTAFVREGSGSNTEHQLASKQE
jgi:hydrogenase-1 operon protein HyaF